MWDSFQKLKHGRKKDYKILIYVLVTKISKCKLKIQITSADRLLSLKSPPSMLILKKERNSKIFRV